MTSHIRNDPQAANHGIRYRQLFNAIDQGFCVIEMVFDPKGIPVDYRFVEVNAAFEQQTGLKDATTKTMREHHPTHEDHWFRTYGDVAKTGQSIRFEAAAAALGEEYEVFAFPFDDPCLYRVGILFNSITERKRTERLQSILVKELNHRVKNVLTLVQSLARQSLRGAAQPLRDSFIGRLSALGRAHSLLLDAQWQATCLTSLVQAAAAPYDEDGKRRFWIKGPDLALNPKEVQSMILVLHELSTNAAKYGALSSPAGQVAVAWTLEGDDTKRLVLTWTETNGPPVTAPSDTGFGTQLLTHVLAGSLGGIIDLDYRPEGLVARIDLPADQLLATGS